jgi:single-strand DNA-binding protein
VQINEIYFAGNLGQDAKVFTTKDDKKVVTLRLCHSNKDKTPTWVNVKCFGVGAEISKDFRKGQSVFIIGFLTENKWTGKDGVEKATLEIVARQVHLVSKPEAVKKPSADIVEPDPVIDDFPF